MAKESHSFSEFISKISVRRPRAVGWLSGFVSIKQQIKIPVKEGGRSWTPRQFIPREFTVSEIRQCLRVGASLAIWVARVTPSEK